jgi:hypothetical protein
MGLKDWFRALHPFSTKRDRGSPEADLPDAIVLGLPMAQAIEAQRLHKGQGESRRSPLAEMRYADAECRLWRWTNSALDSAIEAIVAEFARLAPSERQAMRDSLALEDFYTLFIFVQRCVLFALRTGEAGRIPVAFTAIAMVARARVDWRDLLVAIWLARYAGQRLNAPVADIAARAARLAEPATAKDLLADRKRPVKLAEACGYREVVTSQGVALFRTRYEPFSPSADIAAIAFAAALALEAEGYRISDIELATDLPLVWLNADERTPLARMVGEFSGCASIHGVPATDPEPAASGQSLLVFLAEAASASDAQDVALAATRATNAARTVLGMASDRLCAVIIQRSFMADIPPLEDGRALERLRPMIEKLLTQR